MQRQLHHLVQMVDDLLDVERITHGKVALRKTRVAVAEFLDAAIETCRPQLLENTRKLEVSMPARDVFVEGDGVRLAQVVSNLLNNAFKFTPEGGKIELFTTLSRNMIEIHVRDTGKGLNAEILPRLFDMYSQAEPLSATETKGLGVGLALVQSLVEIHGGSVSASSGGIGKGSEFLVRLPVMQTSQAEAPQGKTVSEAPSHDHLRKVLIVDDNLDAAETLAMLIEGDGHVVHSAGNALDAFELAREFQPDVAILDIGMPKMDGYEAAGQLRKIRPHIVLIALSGWRINPSDPRAAAAGFSHCLIKPVHAEEVNKLLASL